MRKSRVYDGNMIQRTGCFGVASVWFFTACICNAQTLGNQALSGKYYFRHLSLATGNSTPVTLTEARSLIGTITFDGAGKYTFTGQQNIGTSAAAPLSRDGTYTVDAGGFVSLDNPQRTTTKINARYSTEGLLGSTTESADTFYDLFIAIPAPAAGAALSGPYTTVSIEFPGASTANMRASQFSLASSGAGTLAP